MISTVDYIVKGTFIDYPIPPEELSLPSLRRGATDPCHFTLGKRPLPSMAPHYGDECDSDLDEFDEKAAPEAEAFQGTLGHMQKQAMESGSMNLCHSATDEFPLLSTAVPSGSECDGDFDGSEEEVVPEAVGESSAFAKGDFGSACRATPAELYSGSDCDGDIENSDEEAVHRAELGSRAYTAVPKGGGNIFSNSPRPPFRAIAEPKYRAVSPNQLCYFVPCPLEGWFHAVQAAGWNPMQSLAEAVLSPPADNSGEWPSQALPAALRAPVDRSSSSKDEDPTTSLILQASSCESLEKTTSCEPPALRMTTVMIRGIPNNVTRDGFIMLLNSKDLYSKFDFVYMPRDHETGSGRGYAFVNFVSHAVALDAWNRLHGFGNWSEIAERYCSEKVVTLDWAKDDQQGLDKQIERYRNSSIMHPATPEPYRPVIFRSGERVIFPSPTERIRAPRIRAPRGK